MDKNCPRCGTLMKFVPAGVSHKTGRPKPYNAFYKCKGCSYGEKAGGTQQGNSTYYQAKPAPQQQPPSDVLITLVGEVNALTKRISALEKAVMKDPSVVKSGVPDEPVDEIKPEDIPF